MRHREIFVVTFLLWLATDALLLAGEKQSSSGLAAATSPRLIHDRQVHADFEGRLEIIQEDDFVNRRTRQFYLIRDEGTGVTYELDLQRAMPAWPLATNSRVRVRGLFDKARTRIVATFVEPLTPPFPPLRKALVGEAVRGQQKAVVLMVNFQDATPSCSAAKVVGHVWTDAASADAFWRASSFEAISFPADSDGNGSPDVFGPFTISAHKADPCNFSDFSAEADAAAEAAGLDLSAYAYRIYVFPRSDTCTGGLGTVGPCGSFCRTWIFSCSLGVFTHELGHNLGMRHASSDLDNDGIIDPAPLGYPGLGEYGDFSDVMGNGCDVANGGTGCQPNAPHKVQQGWFPAGHVLDVGQSGVYTLEATETDPDQTSLPQALRIFGFYYLSTRRATGFDSGIDANAFGFRFAGRTSIHRHSDWEPECADESGNAFNCAPIRTLFVKSLADGEVFQDSGNRLTVTQLSHDSTSVTVRIDLGDQGIDFHTVTPCRVFDTRQSYKVYSGYDYVFLVGGRCGIPANARAVSVNLTVAQADGAGHVAIVPGNVSGSQTSTLNFKAGQTRANNAIIQLAPDGYGIIRVRSFVQGFGGVDVILDVNGYFQ